MRKDKKTNMQDIADRLQISKTTVAFALQNKKGVGESLRRKIWETAKEMNYDKLDKYEDSDNRSKNILLVIPDYLSTSQVLKPFYYDIILGIEKEARARDLNAIPSFIDRDMEVNGIFPKIMKEIQFCGMLLLGVVHKSFILKVAEEDIPFVLVDHFYPDLPANAVVTANLEGAYQCVQHLIDSGHRNIGFIGPVHMTHSNYERWMGYRMAMTDYGLDTVPAYSLTESRYHSANDEEIGAFLDQLASYPTAWFCANDNMAITLLNELARRNIQVPDQVSVVGFDDIEGATIVSPNLTTYRVPKGRISEGAIELLVDNLDVRNEKRKIHYYGELIKRDSVKLLT